MKLKLYTLIFTSVFLIASCDMVFSGNTYEALSENMLPTIPVGAKVKIHKGIYDISPVERGDIIVFVPDYNKSMFIISRIIALPNETIEIKGEEIFINGKVLAEDYASYKNEHNSMPKDVAPIQLGRDKYFIMGDNRYNSSDSRHYGPISKSEILGKSLSVIK